MERIPFSQKLRNARINIKDEYNRVYELFYLKENSSSYHSFTMKKLCENSFMEMPFKDTCISLDDFTENYLGYFFPAEPYEVEMDLLITFCEYSYNLVRYCNANTFDYWNPVDIYQAKEEYERHILKLMEKLGYMQNDINEIVDFVPIDQVAISVAELVDDDLSYRVIEYNHHSMRGNLDQKKTVLLKLGEKLEPLRKSLRRVDSSLESDLFMLLNKLSIRHNNTEEGGSQYEPYVAEMTSDTIEEWYDETYQMCLLAFLELDNCDRKKKVDELKKAMIQKKRIND